MSDIVIRMGTEKGSKIDMDPALLVHNLAGEKENKTITNCGNIKDSNSNL
jgi:hypothetical protein